MGVMTGTASWWSRATAWFNNAGSPWGGGGSGDGDGGGGDSGGGGGPRNPWSQPPGGGKKPRGPRGSGIEDIQQRMRDKFGGGSGGGGGGSGGPSLPSWPMIRLGLILFAALWILFTSVWRIAPNERGVVTRLGSYSRTIDSGVGLTLPWPIESVTKWNVTGIRELKIPTESFNFVLTGDQNILDLDYTVRWSISNPQLYQFQMADPDETIKEVAESAMRAVISRYSFAGAVGPRRGEIEMHVQRQMTQILNAYRSGVRIDGVAIINAVPPKDVNDAFRDVNAAQQEAQSAINNAKTYAQQTTKRAQGEAAGFDKVYEQYRLAPGVTRRRMYYDTMEEVLAKVDKTIVEVPGVTPYLPLPELKRRLPEPPPAPAAGAR